VAGLLKSFVDSTNPLYESESRSDLVGSASSSSHSQSQSSSFPTIVEETEAVLTPRALSPPRAKISKLFANYATHNTNPNHAEDVESQIAKYLSMTYDASDSENSLAFWERNRKVLPKLFYPALRALSIPASSSPVERVFSRGGLVLRPHRASMSNKMLTSLVFLKCNTDKIN
jgi:hypothetical protein